MQTLNLYLGPQIQISADSIRPPSRPTPKYCQRKFVLKGLNTNLRFPIEHYILLKILF